MTALAAIWRFNGRPDAHSACERMLNEQKLYGLDAHGQWSEIDIALGCRLTRMLPEDQFDRQPLIGRGGDTVLVADIRLDNREDLIRTIGIGTAQAAKLSDADILLAALERWNEECLERIVGDFAFIYWNKAKHKMLLARDPLGQRPLHYHKGVRFFAVATMPKGLHALSEVPRVANIEFVAESLMEQSGVDSRTFFSGIERVQPGHVVSATLNGVTSRRFWSPRRHTIRFSGSRNYAEALREHMDVAVRCRLRGASDVATHLSSGYDSSIVSATAARLLAPASGKVVAFTGAPREGYEGPTPPARIADESPLAAMTAALYSNMEHVIIRSPGKSPLDDLERCFLLFDQPIGSLCNLVWANDINDAAKKRGLKVLLTGDTGNITISYDGLYLLPELFRRGRWLHWWNKSRALVKRRGWRWRGVARQTFGPWLPDMIWSSIERSATKTPSIADFGFVHPTHLAKLGILKPRRIRDPRVGIFCSDDFGIINKGMLAGWGLDRRDPTADVRLIEFCLGVPTEQFMRNGVSKVLARSAFSDRLPAAILDEPRRGIQAADWHERLSTSRDRVEKELARIALCPAAREVLDLEKLQTRIQNWPRDGWERNDVGHIYRIGLLRALAVGHFLRRATR